MGKKDLVFDPPRLRSPARPDSNGYFRISLKRDNKTKTLLLHHLVAAAFHGPRPDGLHIAHLNGNSADNRAVNLAYVTPSENISHQRVHGTAPTGDTHPQAKLTADDVKAMRAACQPGVRGRGYVALGRQYGVCAAVAKKAITGASWKHVA